MDAAATADAAAAADAVADPTLEFDPLKLKAIYDDNSRYIVGFFPSSPGVMSTKTHDVVAVHSELMSDHPEDVPDTVQYYSTDTEALVDAVAKLSSDVTVLFVVREGERLPDVEFSDLDPTDDVCQKVVTFFPLMDRVAMFKGHIVLRNATSRDWGAPEEEVSNNTFSFTAPYASVSFRKNDDVYDPDLLETHSMTLGAPVFNFDGSIVGILSNVGFDYSVKFARNAEYLCGVFSQLWGEETNWVKGEEIARGSL